MEELADCMSLGWWPLNICQLEFDRNRITSRQRKVALSDGSLWRIFCAADWREMQMVWVPGKQVARLIFHLKWWKACSDDLIGCRGHLICVRGEGKEEHRVNRALSYWTPISRTKIKLENSMSRVLLAFYFKCKRNLLLTLAMPIVNIISFHIFS